MSMPGTQEQSLIARDGLGRRIIRKIIPSQIRSIYHALRKSVLNVYDFLRRVPAWPRSTSIFKELQVTRLGTTYGGGYAALAWLNADSIVYSVGVGEEISFDEDLSRLIQCRIFGIDPTPRAENYIKHHLELPPKYQFVSVGLGVSSGIQRFYYPANREHVSMSLVHDSGTGYIDCQFLSLSDLMQQLEHDYVNLLKIDIEGAEYGLVQQWLDEGEPLPIGQIWIEFHPERADSLLSHSLELVSRLGQIGFIPLQNGHNGFLLLNRGFLQISLRAWISLCGHSDLSPL